MQIASTASSNPYPAGGAALSLIGGRRLVVRSSTFRSNVAGAGGAVLVLRDDAQHTPREVLVQDSMFEGAPVAGGSTTGITDVLYQSRNLLP